MLWELSVVEQRYTAVQEVLGGMAVTQVADRYGVSRQSVHGWLRRYRAEGWWGWRTAAIVPGPVRIRPRSRSRRQCVSCAASIRAGDRCGSSTSSSAVG